MLCNTFSTRTKQSKGVLESNLIFVSYLFCKIMINGSLFFLVKKSQYIILRRVEKLKVYPEVINSFISLMLQFFISAKYDIHVFPYLVGSPFLITNGFFPRGSLAHLATLYLLFHSCFWRKKLPSKQAKHLDSNSYSWPTLNLFMPPSYFFLQNFDEGWQRCWRKKVW